MARADERHADLLNNRLMVVGEGVTGWTLANRQPFYNSNPRLDLPPSISARDDSYRTMAVCPLIHGTELHGAITLYSATLSEYEGGHQRLLEELASLLATALSADPQVVPPGLVIPSHAIDKLSPGKGVFSVQPTALMSVAVESELAH